MGHRILCFGDSNTYGYNPRSRLGGRYGETVRWTALLETAGWEIINEGENGRSIPRSDWERAALCQAVRRTKAELAAVMLGSNDLLQPSRPSAAACGERMEQFLAALSEELPSSCALLLIAPPPMKLGTWVNDPKTPEESRQLAGCYAALARRLDIHFADAGAWDVELAFDGVHFSETGHRAFAEGMRKTLNTLFGAQNMTGA